MPVSLSVMQQKINRFVFVRVHDFVLFNSHMFFFFFYDQSSDDFFVNRYLWMLSFLFFFIKDLNGLIGSRLQILLRWFPSMRQLCTLRIGLDLNIWIRYKIFCALIKFSETTLVMLFYRDMELILSISWKASNYYIRFSGLTKETW